MIKKSLSVIALSGIALTTLNVQATIVEFQTSQGNIKVNLFDQATPKTVENFLSYVNDGTYNQTIIHRSIKDFIIQGGGYTFDGEKPVTVTSNAPVINEPVYSNVKGTIAMAKKGSSVNSATNQWFFNLDNNASNLDVQNGGFTVFGQVIEGMETLTAISKLVHCSNTPMTFSASANCSDGTVPGFENYVSISNVDIADATVNTSEDLNPAKNTLINAPVSNSSSGGVFGWLSVLALGLVFTRRKI